MQGLQSGASNGQNRAVGACVAGAAWITSMTWPGMLIWPTLGGVKMLPLSAKAASTAASVSNWTATTDSDTRKENGWCKPAFANSMPISDKLEVGGTLHTWTMKAPWPSSKSWSISCVIDCVSGLTCCSSPFTRPGYSSVIAEALFIASHLIKGRR